MNNPSELRRGNDRRRQPRGGRRDGDRDECAPLVMLVGQDQTVMSLAEAVLAKLRFAVTTSGGVDDALRVLTSLRPDLIVAADEDAKRIRMEAPEQRPVVEMTPEMHDEPMRLIGRIRDTLRANPVH